MRSKDEKLDLQAIRFERGAIVLLRLHFEKKIKKKKRERAKRGEKTYLLTLLLTEKKYCCCCLVVELAAASHSPPSAFPFISQSSNHESFLLPD